MPRLDWAGKNVNITHLTLQGEVTFQGIICITWSYNHITYILKMWGLVFLRLEHHYGTYGCPFQSFSVQSGLGELVICSLVNVNVVC